MKIDGISQVAPTPPVNLQANLKNQGRKKPGDKTGEAAEVPEKPADTQVSTGERKLIEAIEKANNALNGTDCSFRFYIHEETKQIMVKVINNQTNKVIREIPPEEILDAVAKIWEIAGLFIDEKR